MTFTVFHYYSVVLFLLVSCSRSLVVADGLEEIKDEEQQQRQQEASSCSSNDDEADDDTGVCRPPPRRRQRKPPRRLDRTLKDFIETQCQEIYEDGSELPIPSFTDFQRMRQVYHDIVHHDDDNNSEKGEDSEYSYHRLSTHLETGFAVPVQARQSPGKGRGVFATQTIAKGSLVWSNVLTARFPDGPSYQRFILQLPKVTMACDILEWAYVQQGQISVDLELSSLMNSAWGDETQTVGCPKPPDDDRTYQDDPLDCANRMYALVDIAPGEELLCDYGDFADPLGWRDFGLDL